MIATATTASKEWGKTRDLCWQCVNVGFALHPCAGRIDDSISNLRGAADRSIPDATTAETNTISYNIGLQRELCSNIEGNHASCATIPGLARHVHGGNCLVVHWHAHTLHSSSNVVGMNQRVDSCDCRTNDGIDHSVFGQTNRLCRIRAAHDGPLHLQKKDAIARSKAVNCIDGDVRATINRLNGCDTCVRVNDAADWGLCTELDNHDAHERHRQQCSAYTHHTRYPRGR